MITMKYIFVAILVAVFNIVVVNSNGRVCGTGAGTTTENSPVTLNCGAEVIDSIDFASYGRPTGTCGSYAIGTCHASNSVTTVSTACLDKTTCTISVSNAAFGGDPCVAVAKFLLIQARCRAPTSQPTGQPSKQPSRQPTNQPTRQPTNQPTGQPTSQPTRQPTSQPNGQPTSQPTRQPTQQPSNQPSGQPSRQPSNQPSSQPSNQPSTRPTTQPSSQPSNQPTSQPSQPSSQPSSVPSCQPASHPSTQPSIRPSSHPTMQPSQQPTTCPTSQPSMHPSSQPSQQPASLPTSQPSMHPSKQPSQAPTSQPSSQPHSYPSTQPSRQPSSQPSQAPSQQPSSTPSCQPTAQPSKQPSSQPAAQPTQQPQSKPSSFPSKQPSSYPSLHPSTQPSSAPSNQPFSHPSSKPSSQPSSQPSLQPFARPTGMPKRTPTSQPSSVPSTKPTGQPVAPPSTQPTSHPSQSPTSQPVSWPSSPPTSQPSIHPSAQPSSEPSFSPSSQPSNSPSCQPTSPPSVQPSAQPRSEPSSTPSDQPSGKPSSQPSKQPLGAPTSQPTIMPSQQPSSSPSCGPSTQPVSSPTSTPTCQPSRQPSRTPTTQPSAQPTNQPSLNPTSRPTIQPSTQPTGNPSSSPSAQPLSVPSGQPSNQPLARPTRTPSSQPSSRPTTQPSRQPSLIPTSEPSVQPSSQPSTQPSSFPSTSPSSQPSRQPSAQPSQLPTSQPTLHPTSQPSRQPNVRPSSQPSITPSSQPSSAPSHTRRPTFDRTFGTLPRNTSLSVQYPPTAHSVSPSFKIVLPFLFGAAQTGDGFDDIVLGAAVNGSNYILFGSNATRHHLHTRLLSVTSPAVSYDYSGRSVSNAGDVNGDGYNDLIIGVPFAARCYVLFGTSQGFVNMTEGFTVFGAQSTDLTGWSVSAAGDVNNDTFADIIIGAPLANHGRLASVGASYVLYGQGSRFVDVYLEDDLDESRGFSVYGAEPADCLGLSVSAAGDVNGDGYADVVMGVLRSGRYFSGGAYVVFGDSVPPSAMTVFAGSVWSYAGFSVSGAGDVNGDRFSDVLIGSVPRRTVYETAMSYLVYGAARWDDAVSLGNLTSRGVAISGGGMVVSGVGDIDGDGFEDVMVGNNYGLVAGAGFLVDYSQFKLEALPTASPTRLPTLQPSVKPSRRPTMNPGRSSPPSQKPTAPSQPPSIAPSGPTILPTARQSSPTSCPSSTPPSSRPSSSPSEASKPPTSLPSLVPTPQPSAQLTSVSPSAAPTEEPSIAPSRRPTFSPTLGRRFPTRQPSANPTAYTEYFENNVTTIVISVSANVSRLKQPHRVHYIVNASIGEVRIVAPSSQVRGDVFTILRLANVSLTISHFSSRDVIDLAAFADIHSLVDLHVSYVGNSVIFRLPHNQIVKLLNFAPQLIRADMFIFGQNGDSAPEGDDFMGTQKASFVNVVSTASSVVFVVLCYVVWRVHSAINNHNKKEKYTPQSPLLMLETLRTDEEYWAQLDLSAHTTNHSDSNSNGDSGSDVPSLQTNDSEQRMIAALLREDRVLRSRDRDRARERVDRDRVVARTRNWEQTRAAHRAHSVNLEVDVSGSRREYQLLEDDDSVSGYECESDNEYRACWSDPEAGDEVVYSEWDLYPQCLDNNLEDGSDDSSERSVGFCNSQNSINSLDSYNSAMFTISSGRSDNNG